MRFIEARRVRFGASRSWTQAVHLFGDDDALARRSKHNFPAIFFRLAPLRRFPSFACNRNIDTFDGSDAVTAGCFRLLSGAASVRAPLIGSAWRGNDH